MKAIIFDYGGVISSEKSLNDLGKMYAEKYGKDSDKFNELIKETWMKARVNEMTSQKFWESCLCG